MNAADDTDLIEAIRHAYREVHLGVPLADIQHGQARQPRRPAARVALAAGLAVVLLVAGVWWLVGSPGTQSAPMPPGQPSPSASTGAPGGKPPRPTSSATTDAGLCDDYGRAELAQAGHVPPEERGALPPLRFALADGQTRLRLYLSDTVLLACWLSGDQVLAVEGGGPATSTDLAVFPVGQFSYYSADSGHGFGGYVLGRAPAGTTRVELAFPDGSRATATLDGEWYVVLRTGAEAERLAEVTEVIATTPAGVDRRPVQHG